jgi:single-stranded DNA-binding protein
VWVPLDKQHVARGTIGFFPVVAFGRLAEELASLPARTAISVTAKLTMRRWQTREGKDRSQMELSVLSLEVIEKPLREVA